VVDSNLKTRLDEAAEADKIVTEEVDRVEQWMLTRQAVPLIVSLQEQLEKVRIAEYQRLRGKLGNLTPQQEEAVDALTRGIINKIAHAPMAEIRRHAASPNGNGVVEVIRKIFRLDE
jgi:glutamyl-tRNA reductase